MHTLLELVLVLTIVGAGIMGGVFFAFSTFVMRALADLPAEQGIAAMRRINIVVINPWFMTPFLGTALLGVTLIAMRLLSVPGVSTCAAVGGTLYAVGTFGVTMFGNVPLNNRLAKMEAGNSETVWRDYVRRWTRWNHVRSAAAISAVAAIAIG